MTLARRRALPAIAGVFLIAPSSAAAHLASSGMGPVYDGVLHFLRSPEDLVAVTALALLAGLRGPASARRALLALPLAWLAGCLIGMIELPASTAPIAAISFIVLGALVALDAKVSLGATTALAVALGLAHGALNGGGMRASLATLAAFAGLVAAVAVVMALVSALIVRIERPWLRIGVRVAGSWIVASGLLLLGWSFRPA